MRVHAFRRHFVALAVAVLAIATIVRATEPKPLPQAHAHNDYEHARPLLDALDHGFCSVEADIWLTPDGLLIGHDKKDLKPGRTLESLYLDPLRERIKTNGGRVYRDGPPFYLLVDVKTEAEATYAALDKVLAGCADILSVTREGKRDAKAVTVILSGNRASETIAKQSVRYVKSMAGRRIWMLTSRRVCIRGSARIWTLLFKWNGEGAMPATEREKLRDLVKRTHVQGRKIRFWNTAEKEAMWKELLAAGVDYINTDKLDELQRFLLSQ